MKKIDIFKQQDKTLERILYNKTEKEQICIINKIKNLYVVFDKHFDRYNCFMPFLEMFSYYAGKYNLTKGCYKDFCELIDFIIDFTIKTLSLSKNIVVFPIKKERSLIYES